MINMMKDILQYVPYALFVGVIFLIMLTGAAYTIGFFRKSGRRAAKR